MFDELLNNISLGSVSKLLFLLTLIIISIDVVFALINIIIDYYSENSAIIFNNIFTLKNSEKCSRLKYQYHDDTIFSFSEQKMIFFISHRLSNMKKVDKIIFLEDGEVVECGMHDELMSLHGKYSELFEKQAKNFT